MRLSEYPRPVNDNRIGVHGTASIYHDWVKDANKKALWLDRLQVMKIKWYKLLDDSGGSSLELVKALHSVGIMPVIRLYRGQPNPGTIGSRETDTIKAIADILGFRPYIETNNEPDLACEWQNNTKPDNWLTIVVDNWIIDADRVIGAGGLPAFPAFGPGTGGNPFQMVVDRGRKDLFEKGMWEAMHNYCGGRSLEYPNDDVHQKGVALTQEEYDNSGGWWAWEMSLTDINTVRARDKKPGQTIYEDFTCFRAYERLNKLIIDACGHSLPIMMTEGGYNVGQRFDQRYAKPTPNKMGELTLRMMRYMAGEERILGNTVPDYYFASMPWLLANYQLNHWESAWEAQGPWYTDWFNDQFGLRGELPIVGLLKGYTPVSPSMPSPTSIIEIADKLTVDPVNKYTIRDVSTIKDIVLHHTGVDADNTPEQIAVFHVKTNGWPGIGYHYYIMRNGNIYHTNRDETVSYHAGNWEENKVSIGVCLTGSFIDGRMPTEAQMTSLYYLLTLYKNLILRYHKDVSSSGTICPGDLVVDTSGSNNNNGGEGDDGGSNNEDSNNGESDVVIWDKRLDPLGVKRIEYTGTESYWKLTSAKWQNEAEAKGQHHIYVKAIKNGAGIAGQDFIVQNGGVFHQATKDAADNYLGNYPMDNFLGSYSAYLPGNSDKVTGMGLGQALDDYHWYHTCFSLEFTWTEGGNTPPILTFEEKVKTVMQPFIIPYVPDTKARKVATEKGLGEAVSDEHPITIDGVKYIAQVFVRGIFICPEGNSDAYQVINRTN
jgi:hypothetical protein